MTQMNMSYAAPIQLLTGARILIVEDNLLVAIDLEMALANAGARTMIASSLSEARVLLLNYRFDFALVDYELEHETSEPLLDALDQQNVAYIVLSGYDAPDIGPTGEKRTVLVKPQAPQDLAKRIAAQLDKN